jgi:threonine aldolase
MDSTSQNQAIQSMHQVIDLRSDTVTRPTPAMRAAMSEAEVDDDVIDVDPTVRRLQEKTAALMGKEAAIFMPSGTMTNQVALRVHCKPGDEFLCEAGCHIYYYEQGGFAQLSGLVARTVSGDGGVLTLEQLEGLLRPDNEHFVRTKLVTLENTHNRGAGKILPQDEVIAICDWAHTNGLKTHLDGARFWNAAVASGKSFQELAAPFDSVSVCFSKGLGAPVGSCLAGTSAAIAEARRHRKLFGGGMRQSGILAAAAIHALDHHVERLSEDHANAKTLARAISKSPWLKLTPEAIDTNMVVFQIKAPAGSAAAFITALEREGVRALAVSATQVRLVTHLDVSASACEAAGEIIVKLAEKLAQMRMVV